MTTVTVVDTASVIPGADLEAAGIFIVARYPPLAAAEVADLTAHKRGILSLWERGNNAALDGAVQGQSDARNALDAGQRSGQPAGTAWSFSVDFDAEGGGNLPRVLDYFHGAQLIRNTHQVVAYAGAGVLDALGEAWLIDWGFQAAAWNYGGPGYVSRYARIVQGTETSLDGFQLDPDTMKAGEAFGDLGAWNGDGRYDMGALVGLFAGGIIVKNPAHKDKLAVTPLEKAENVVCWSGGVDYLPDDASQLFAQAQGAGCGEGVKKLDGTAPKEIPQTLVAAIQSRR